MKKITLLLGSILFWGVGASLALAVDASQYQPLAPLPIGTGGATPDTYTLSTYLSGIIKLIIALGAIFSILMMVVGGTQYIASASIPDAKHNAVERITNSLVGLGLILASYMILYSINPKLVQLNLSLQQATGGEAAKDSFGGAVNPQVVGVGNPWPLDTKERDQLKAAGIPVKGTKTDQPCTVVKTPETSDGCTSVYNLPQLAIDHLIALKKACNCNITVTGGTEYWAHQTHGTATTQKPIVDIDDIPKLTKFISDNGVDESTNRPCGQPMAVHFYMKGTAYDGAYVYEDGNHWHVCFQ